MQKIHIEMIMIQRSKYIGKMHEKILAIILYDIVHILKIH